MGDKSLITLIGTSHLDFKGYKRLMKILKYLNPPRVSIEDTEEEFKETSKLLKWLSKPKNLEIALEKARKQFPGANPETLRLLFSSEFYEVKAVGKYSRTHNIPILYCDSPEELDQINFEAAFKSVQSESNKTLLRFLRLTPEQAKEDIEKEYVEDVEEVYPIADNPQLVRFYSGRDKFTKSILRQQKENILYVCGLDHIFGDYHPNLYDRLIDLNPKRMKLNEADKIDSKKIQKF